MPAADGTPSPKPITELVSPEPSSLVKLATGFGKTLFVVAMAAAAQFIQDHSVEITMLVLGLVKFLPAFVQSYAGAALGGAVTALAVWLKKRSEAAQKEKVLDALVTQPPQDLSRYYK